MHKGLSLIDILPRMASMKYLMVMDVSPGYHNLKTDDKSLYLTTFSCPFYTYWYVTLPIGATLAGDTFKKKTDELFGGMGWMG